MIPQIETMSGWELYSELYPRICAAEGERIVLVRGEKMTSMRGLLDECSAALQFPPRPTSNWDSFSEDFFSLEWIAQSRKILVVLNADRVLTEERESERTIFFNILVDAPVENAKEWASRGDRESSFEVILQTDEAHRRELEKMFAEIVNSRTQTPPTEIR